jgi:hypothetical protein
MKRVGNGIKTFMTCNVTKRNRCKPEVTRHVGDVPLLSPLLGQVAFCYVITVFKSFDIIPSFLHSRSWMSKFKLLPVTFIVT